MSVQWVALVNGPEFWQFNFPARFQLMYSKGMSAPLVVTNLCKTYRGGMGGRGIPALQGVSLELRPGEVFGLLGPNGAGKTTLVKAILSLLSADAGDCLIYGESPESPVSRLRVGFMPENHRYPRRMTPRSLLRLAARLSLVEESEIPDRIERALTRVDMLEWADTRIAKFSKGMSQRVGIAQALLGDPDLLILDEPNEGIDPVGRAQIGQIIRGLRDAGKTILINSHALAEIQQICDRVAILHHGKLLLVGAVSELTAVGSVYVIEADFGSTIEAPPPEIGELLSRTDERWEIRMTDDSQVDRLTDWLRERGVSIRSLNQERQTLEEVFVRLINPEGEGGGERAK